MGTYSGPVLHRPATPSDLLRSGLESNPHGLALVSARTRLTWQALDDLSTRLARAVISDLGLEPGDRIASLMPNRFELVVHYLRLLQGGAGGNAAQLSLHSPRDRPCLDVSDARALLAHVERDEDLQRVSGSSSCSCPGSATARLHATARRSRSFWKAIDHTRLFPLRRAPGPR